MVQDDFLDNIMSKYIAILYNRLDGSIVVKSMKSQSMEKANKEIDDILVDFGQKKKSEDGTYEFISTDYPISVVAIMEVNTSSIWHLDTLRNAHKTQNDIQNDIYGSIRTKFEKKT